VDVVPLESHSEKRRLQQSGNYRGVIERIIRDDFRRGNTISKEERRRISRHDESMSASCW
jgi:hypothetical protein